MLFNSYIFILLFLPVVVSGYYILNHFKWYKAAQMELLAASWIFYGYYNPCYLFVMLASILTNYWIYKKLSTIHNNTKKWVLISGLIFNVGILGYFKYLNFMIENVNLIFKTDFFVEKLMLPLGISFYTFQQISFLVDTYYGDTDSKYTFLDYAEFVSFFPQLVAGPIVSYKIIPQLKNTEKRRLNFDNMASGFMLFVSGLFKKVILADTFAKGVNWGFDSIAILSSIDVVLIMLSYTFQIYFDFSGYSDMALGLAHMFNIELPVNFNAPYRSRSIVEFWQRWHMSLTAFLHKYIYIPLGGNRKGILRTYMNIFIVFLISGLWHGANWTFVLWGAIHGIANIINRIIKKSWDRVNIVLRWVCTFVFINFTWLIFRSDSISQAISLFARMFAMDGRGGYRKD